jgi:hypothetical protein
MLWEDVVKEVLEKKVDEAFRDKIDEFIEFLWDLLMNLAKDRSKYAYHMWLLITSSDSLEAIGAKVNAFYAFLVYKGYVPPYKLQKEKYLRGNTYTWIRLYREVFG